MAKRAGTKSRSTPKTTTTADRTVPWSTRLPDAACAALELRWRELGFRNRSDFMRAVLEGYGAASNEDPAIDLGEVGLAANEPVHLAREHAAGGLPTGTRQLASAARRLRELQAQVIISLSGPTAPLSSAAASPQDDREQAQAAGGAGRDAGD